MRLYFFLFLLLIALHAADTNEYSIIIGGPFEDALYDITEDHDGQISAVGYSQMYAISHTSSQTYHNAFDYLASLNKARGEQLRLLRLDGQGRITLDKSLNLTQFNRAVSVIKTPQNGYFVGGDTQDGELLVVHFGSNGEILYTHKFGTENFDRLHRLIALRDGGLLAVGSSITSRSLSDSIYEQGLGLNDIFLTRFSKSGNKEWSKKYGTIYDDRGITATEAYDGTILVAGTTDIGKNRNITLMRVTENGDKIWLRQYGHDGVLNLYNLITLRDNHFLASLTYQDSDKGEQIRLAKFDLQRNLLAEHNISTETSAALYNIKEQSDGKIIGVGYSIDTAKANTDALAICFDPTLKPLWKQNYGNQNRNLFRSVKVLHDGSYAAAGESVAPHSEVTNMWIVKLHNDGSVVQLSANVRSLYEHLRNIFNDEIRTGKITVNKDLTITLIHPTLLFKTGVYTLTAPQKKFLNSFSPRLLKALQPYRSQISALRINGHTSSEWKNTDFTHRYLNNAKLSTQRAYSVLSDIFSLETNQPYQKWLSNIVTNDGYAFSQTIKRQNEDKVLSRRVEFKIVVK